MTSRILFLLAVVAGLLTVTGGTAAACSCAQLTPRERVDQAVAVFTGTATEVRLIERFTGGGKVTATLRTDLVYKGEPEAAFEVSTRAQGPACGYRFVEGTRYLIFAGRQDGELTTTLCSGNVELPAGTGLPRPTGDTDGTVTPELVAALAAPASPTPSQAPASSQASASPVSSKTAAPAGSPGVATVAAAGVAALVAGLAWAYRRFRAGA
jgi:hypothetical protein